VKKCCALVLADTGPLITLAYANALDLLLLLDMPIYIVDEVYYEATHNKKYKDAILIKSFISKHKNIISIPETFIGNSASKFRSENPDKKTPRDLGEAAIQNFINNDLFKSIGEDIPALLLFEDDKNITIGNDMIHLLSTKKLIYTLAELGLIDSGMTVWKKINDNGRTPFNEID
jgi:hypothetical protein